jgi:hypothetical protein
VKKKKLLKKIARLEREAFIQRAIIRSCHDYACLLWDYGHLPNSEFRRPWASSREGLSNEAFVDENTERVMELTKGY